MLEAVKLALRIKTNKFDSELNDLISAAKADLKLCGIQDKGDTDPLIKRAVILYCKANFGADPDSEKYQQSYDMLKGSLQIAGDYRAAE